MQNQVLDKSSLKVLKEEQVKKYEEMGFLSIESFVRNKWLSDLQYITYKMIQESRKVKETNDKFILEPNHSSDNPRLLRLNMPQDQHEIYSKFDIAYKISLVDGVASVVPPESNNLKKSMILVENKWRHSEGKNNFKK